MFNNIKRNKLDYILTDMLPVEISEIFTFRYFYEYLLSDQSLNDTVKLLHKSKINNTNLFDANWNSMPFDYEICKRNGGMRKMSVPNPLGALMAYGFVSTYEKEILDRLNAHGLFSLRYHKNNSKLYYQCASKRVVKYFSKTINKLQKRAIEQSGSYYKIEKYRGINDFTSSKKWYSLCMKYKKIARIDYKNCFRSIYSHAFNWFVLPNIADSKEAQNVAGLNNILDKVMQRINGSATNGLIVGPEFSRMVAELFLQNIDMGVYELLKRNGYSINKDYYVGRYVDDIFIFANSDEVIEFIIKSYSTIAAQYLMTLNESKIVKKDLPINQSPWFLDAYSLAKEIADLFYNDSDESEFYYKKKSSFGPNMKQKLNQIICDNEFEFRETICAYILGTILNHVKPQKKGKIFDEKISKGKLMNFLDFILYVYSQSTSFNNTQRTISIIYYIAKDINNEVLINNSLKILFKNYETIFKSNIYDIINLLPLLSESGIELSAEYEDVIEKKIFETNDPILLANWMSYSKYNEKYYAIICQKVTKLLYKKLEYLRNKKGSFFMYRDCWYIFIFYNCPFIDAVLRKEFRQFLIETKNLFNGADAACKAKTTVINFMLASQNGFFCWQHYGREIPKQIAYRTNQNTIFRNGGKRYKIFDYASF